MPTTEKKLIVPTVHINGTSGERLSEGFYEAAHAIDAARDKLAEAAPHARDYYVQGPSAYKLAKEQHLARMNKLTEVYDELFRIWEAVEDQWRR